MFYMGGVPDGGGAMLADRLQRQWRENVRFRPLSAGMSLEPEGLILGSGTVLARAEGARSGQRRLRLDGGETRLLALLSIAYGRPIPVSVLGNIRKASEQWSRGENCRAAIHLAFARLPKFDDPSEAARRLFLADGLIAGGTDPLEILAAFTERAVSPDDIEKFSDEDETRVPRGNGKASGEWTTSAGTRSFLEALPKLDLLPLAEFAGRFVVPTATAGLMFFPSRGGAREVEGQVEGIPDLRYAWNEDETTLRITDATGKIILAAEHGTDDLFRDDRQRVVGRSLGDHVVLDTETIRAELPKETDQDEEPKLCPVPDKDKAGRTAEIGAKDKDYEDYVKLRVNPENPTPRGFGVQLPNPANDNKPVYYDDCQRKSDTLIEAKGTGYARMLANKFMQKIIAGKWLDQAWRQIEASQGRPIQWHFAEKAAADFARELFERKGFDQIQVIYTPWEG
jgi:hypothetical protein